MGQILVTDDEPVVCESCRRVLERDGHTVECALTVDGALERLGQNVFDLVLVDLRMPDRDGLDLLREVKEGHPNTEVVVITGHSSIRSAVEAIRSGAHDYLPKPFRPEELQRVVDKALEHQRLRRENLYLRRELDHLQGVPELVGQSPRMQEVFGLIRRVGPTDSTVLVYGESGTGKELVARAIHLCSRRRDQRLVAVDCSALSETLLESELFGHVRGAFTGAAIGKPGLFEVADGGSFFLDEVSHLTLTIQSKLLRVIQEREVLPIGATRARKVDVRIIAATQPDLEERMAKGLFREDLFYRLHIVPIHLPPLRERRQDIPLIARSFLGRLSERTGAAPWVLLPETLEKLQAHDWPGNVRELENVLERATILAESHEVRTDHVRVRRDPAGEAPPTASPRTNEELKQARQKARNRAAASVERAFVLDALTRNQGNVSGAARDVGMKRQNFQALMRRHGISRS
jgi:DNA-binding NtrC family response regulator